MSRAADHDPGGQGGTVASIADAPSRRRHALRPGEPALPASMTSELDAGINLIDNCDLSAEDLGGPGDADDILDRHAHPANATRAETTSTDTAVDADTALAEAQRGPARVEDERDDIHEQLEHHHERRFAPRTPTVPRGSADLAPTPAAAHRDRRARPWPRLSPGGLRRSGLGLALAGVLAGVALLAGTLLDPASGRHVPTLAVAHQLASDQAPGSDAIRHSIAPAAAALADDARRAAQRAQADAKARARAKAAARAKAKTRARAKARSAVPARAARAPQAATRPAVATSHPAVATPASTPTAASTTPSSTETPSRSSGSTTSSKRSSSTSAGGSSPAGPTGLGGQVGGSCAPQCH